jgi:DNA polymerase-3 subunit epsilon
MRGGGEACGCFPTGRHYPGIAHLIALRVAGVAEELSANDPWAALPIAMLDTETTGRDGTVDRIVEIGIIVGQNGAIVARQNWLINPGVPIPKGASDVHGILDEHVKDAPSFAQVADEVAAMLAGAIPAAYNANFDRGFLRNEMRRAGKDLGPRSVPALRDGVEWLDPLVWARHIQRHEKSRALGDVAQRLGIALENAHRASDDAEAALRVMWALATDARVPAAYGAFIQEQRRLSRQQEEEMRMFRR